ncbi:MAG: hypothetical protein KatS3mg130_0626 [Candidatus Sumerlaea sp.]|jgi:hypothetical protein|nr:MAG: hypothetical protein KatS3mg130_0626 [Candidatus Sumerlaea sp.]
MFQLSDLGTFSPISGRDPARTRSTRTLSTLILPPSALLLARPPLARAAVGGFTTPLKTPENTLPTKLPRDHFHGVYALAPLAANQVFLADFESAIQNLNAIHPNSLAAGNLLTPLGNP